MRQEGATVCRAMIYSLMSEDRTYDISEQMSKHGAHRLVKALR